MLKDAKCCSSSGVMKRGASPGNANVESVSQLKDQGIADACAPRKKRGSSVNARMVVMS